MKNTEEKFNIDWFKKNDEPGNAILNGIEVDHDGDITMYFWECNKLNCNCSGGWHEGFGGGEYYIRRPE